MSPLPRPEHIYLFLQLSSASDAKDGLPNLQSYVSLDPDSFSPASSDELLRTLRSRTSFELKPFSGRISWKTRHYDTLFRIQQLHGYDRSMKGVAELLDVPIYTVRAPSISIPVGSISEVKTGMFRPAHLRRTRVSFFYL